MSDTKKMNKVRKVGLYPRLSTNRHLNARQFGTLVGPRHKVISHLDWNAPSNHIKHTVEYITEWQ